MKTIGLVGGTGWISTVEYYRIINRAVNNALGGIQFARCMLYSLNYGDINALNQQNDQEGIYSLLLDAIKKLIKCDSDCIVLCANTLHMHADRLEKQINVPLIHIATATATEIKKQNLKKIGLLGTKYTMEQDFYKDKLRNANIDVVIPDANDREFIHSVIMDELLKEFFNHESKERFLQIIDTLASQGAEGIILGCTEIPLLITADDTPLPLFNTTVIHSLAAVEFALADNLTS